MQSPDYFMRLGSRPLRRLGQNFLVDKTARDLIVNSADLSKSDTVLEVGPGFGRITRLLLAAYPSPPATYALSDLSEAALIEIS